MDWWDRPRGLPFRLRSPWGCDGQTLEGGSCLKNLLTTSFTCDFPVQRGERQMIIFYNLLGIILHRQEAPQDASFIQHTLTETARRQKLHCLVRRG